MQNFKTLGLGENLLKAIEDLGFQNPSEVQSKAIPILLSEETDLVALAQTGTGKTAAFGFPLIQKINPKKNRTQGLVLSPTRELCLQITNELKLYSKYEPSIKTVAIYGGASITEQANQIKRGAQIIVATPGRMKDMISRGMVDITEIEYCVLDEADEMLNMGFYEDINDILANTPENKRTWLFSATMPKEVATIAKNFMKKPQEITVGSKNEGASTVTHQYYVVSGRDRYPILKRLADANPNIFSVVFCRTKRDTQKVAEKLIEDGYNAGALHGDLSQNQRDMVMNAFRKKQIRMLVATDVAARGIDVDDITHVINYQLPDEIETYTHRSGRTGRAGKEGVSMVIVTRSEVRKIKSIERIIKKEFIQQPIPTGMEICEVQLFHLANKIKETDINHQIDDYLPKIYDLFNDLDKDALIKKIFSVEFSRFFNYYNTIKDIESVDPSEGPSESSSNSIRYFINVGSRDGFTWGTLKDLIRDYAQLGKDDVFKVDVKDNFSFFNTEPENTAKIIAAFDDISIEGRRVNVEISSNPEEGSSRRNRRKSSGGGKDFKRSEKPRRRDGSKGFNEDKKSSGSRRKDRAPRREKDFSKGKKKSSDKGGNRRKGFS